MMQDACDFLPEASAHPMVAAARRYLGVRFRHQGRSPIHGLDCLGLLVAVAEDCGLEHHGRRAASFDATDYGHIPDAARLSDGLRALMRVVDPVTMAAGDVLLLRIDGNAQHVGIVGDYPPHGFSLIHAYAPARRVVEHRLDAGWQERIVATLRWDV